MQEFPTSVGAGPGAGTVLCLRAFSWAMVALTLTYVLNAYLVFWLGWPGILDLLAGNFSFLGALQLLFYLGALVGPAVWCRRRTGVTLRADADAITSIAAYLVRALFWAVVLVGLADAMISFLRVENLLPAVVGEDLATNLGRSAFRAPWVHLPLIVSGIVIATVTRSLAFHWLAFAVVAAELLIVLTRFVFSYEQAFQADLVRFWYAALFLFASARTLVEDGHVRVDILYAEFSATAKGWANAIGSVGMGMVMCWAILITGMWTQTSTITSPILSLEVTQAGFGLYVKFWMAAFLGAFAVTMLLQFSGYFLSAMADALGEPGEAVTPPDGDVARPYPEIETAEALAGGAPSH